MPRALVIDDDPDFLESLAELVSRTGFEVTIARTLSEARTNLTNGSVSLIVTDLMLPDGSGLDLLKEVSGAPQTDVVIVTGQASVDSVIEALRLGALDYLTKPLDIPRLRSVLTNVARTRSLRDEIDSLRGELRRLGRFGRMIGNSVPMQKVYDLIAKVAPTDASVLITGESGTGKELVAQTVHEISRRRQQPFLPLNCGAVPSTLIESELFGHERGSFTGASQMHRGYFERSSGGTLLLDEITEMPIELQVRLLRVLETGSITRVGGDDLIRVDVRVIASTNRPIDEAVQAGKLREDLLYRLNVFPIALPPLRERGDDTVMLAEHFLEELNQAEGTSKTLGSRATERLRAYPWPGNVRELKNELQRAFIMSEGAIELDQLEPGSAAAPPPGSNVGRLESARVGTPLAAVERELILATLEHCGGDKKKTAALLGISLKTLYNRLNLYRSI